MDMAVRTDASASSKESPADRDELERDCDDADIGDERLLPADSRAVIGTIIPPHPPKRDRAYRPRPGTSRFLLILVRLVARFSLATAHRIGTVAGLLYSFVPGRLRNAGLTNLRIAYPAISDSELKRLARRSAMQEGRMLLELPALWTWPGERVLELVREVEGRELLDAAIARGKGVVVATPHIGAWEMMVLWMGYHASMTAPFRKLRLPELEDFIREARQRTGARMIRGQRYAARDLLRTLYDGGIIGMAPDQDAGFGSGVAVPLFHEVANTGVLIPRLLAKSGAAMLWVYAVRLENSKGYRLHIEAADPEIGSADVVRGARAMNRDIESIIFRYPEQYLWSYRRYRRRPQGRPRNVYAKGSWRLEHSALGELPPEGKEKPGTST
jgi:KDO2-lipid IV(A) lauroyltransferase